MGLNLKVTPSVLCWGCAVLGGDICVVAEDVPHGGRGEGAELAVSVRR